jgi:SpoVK/Ycf46/Vps4 family AAA+-type ATPase
MMPGCCTPQGCCSYKPQGADILSKWVGEAERQLRALFEEAQRQQPAIIFFDEIDGLAPVGGTQQAGGQLGWTWV